MRPRHAWQWAYLHIFNHIFPIRRPTLPQHVDARGTIHQIGLSGVRHLKIYVATSTGTMANAYIGRGNSAHAGASKLQHCDPSHTYLRCPLCIFVPGSSYFWCSQGRRAFLQLCHLSAGKEGETTTDAEVCDLTLAHQDVAPATAAVRITHLHHFSKEARIAKAWEPQLCMLWSTKR